MTEEFYKRYPQLKENEEKIEKAIKAIITSYKNGGTILLCGNGGSESDCDHIVGEFMKGFMLPRRFKGADKQAIAEAFGDENAVNNFQYAVPAISLPSLSAVNTAFINDVAPDFVYAQLMYGYGKKGDVAIGISTSGNSKNVVNALIAAKAKGLVTIALTGCKPNRSENIADIAIKVCETETYKVQELHLPVYHYICAEVERRLFGE